jgi:hypothetical protein
MKNVIISFARRFQFLPGRSGRTHCQSLTMPLVAVIAGLLLASGPAQGANLLVNPGFEANSGHVLPTGWTYFSPPPPPGYFGNYWIESGALAHSGSLYWKQWGALYLPAPTNNVAGIYQEFSSAPGSIYQASGWCYTRSSDLLGADCRTWIEVSFLGASSNVLALFKSADFSASIGADTWLQYQVTNVCDLAAPLASGDPYFTTYAVTGSVSQLIAPAGTAKIRYRYAYLQSGGQGGSAHFEDAILDQISGPIPPVISDVFPLNMIFVNPADGLSFNVSSPSGFTINNSGIQLVVNGVDVSGSLVITGTTANKNVTYSGLQSNQTYTATITVTDSFNFSASANTYFETTWVGIEPVTYLWEAEDFDFSSGMYINNPELCSTIGNPNCYFGKVGVEGVDEHNLNAGGSHLYRPGDAMGTAVSGDYLRKNLFLAGRLDYKIDPFNFSEWVNYTRDWPNSTNWVVARLATDIGLTGVLTLSKVNTNDQTTTDLGTFTIANGRGWSAFDNVYLRDTNGALVNVVLNGRETLRVTSGGNLLPGFFMLVPAIVDLPQLSNLYPTGKRPFEFTNALSFSVTTEGASFPPGGIKLFLNGNDASAGLVITGPADAKTVVYSGLQINAKHTAIITITNSLNHGISITNSFDTFSQDNYMVEAEEFDFNGGMYVSAENWYPNVYVALGATTNIDYEHSPIEGEQFAYRIEGIPESYVQNYAIEARQKFVDYGAFDYQLDWFGVGDWANYSGTYPSGSFYVYVRSSGINGSPYAMHLDQVVSGAGTTNQVLKRLGHWSALGRGQLKYDWVPLTDAGLVAPVAVKLGGVNTLRLTTTTGLCYPNYFMFVPAAGLTVTATRSGGNVSISFPTQTGATYRVFYRTSLSTGNWILLTTVLGNGAGQIVNDPIQGTQRFYQVTSP